MTRLIKVALITLLSCVLLLLLVWAVRSSYLGYIARRDRRAKFDANIENLQHLAHAPWRVRYVSYSITTTDRLQISRYGGDLRLVHGTNTVQKFEEFIGKEPGHIVTAWISDWTPRSEMAKLVQLSVYPTKGAGFEITAQANTNESVGMEFTVTAIVEDRSER